MTNKPMLSVELRELLVRINNLHATGNDIDIEMKELGALLDKEVDGNSHAPKHQGDPVAICRLWNEGGSGERTSVEFIGEPCADGTLLYADPPAPVAHTMRSIMEAVEASRGYTVLTSDQCYALAQSLNGLKT